MERLKGAVSQRGGGQLARFTFQYGEIKSPRASALNRSECEFTFQYGEIKRHGIKVSVRELKTFTFQYGEIKSCESNPARLTF